jgi:hypothetical protein
MPEGAIDGVQCQTGSVTPDRRALPVPTGEPS